MTSRSTALIIPAKRAGFDDSVEHAPQTLILSGAVSDRRSLVIPCLRADYDQPGFMKRYPD